MFVRFLVRFVDVGPHYFVVHKYITDESLRRFYFLSVKMYLPTTARVAASLLVGTELAVVHKVLF